MDLAGVDAATPDPPGGEILRDARGRPTGLFRENAEELIRCFLEAFGPSGEQCVLRLRTELSMELVNIRLLGADTNAAIRSKGFNDIIEKYPDMERVAVIAAACIASMAMTETSDDKAQAVPVEDHIEVAPTGKVSR